MPEAAKGGVFDLSIAREMAALVIRGAAHRPRRAATTRFLLMAAASLVLAGCGSSDAETPTGSETDATGSAGPSPSLINAGGLDLEREWFALAEGEDGPVCSPGRYLTEGFGAKSDGDPDAVARKLGLGRHDIAADYGVVGDGALIVVRGADACWAVAKAAVEHSAFAPR